MAERFGFRVGLSVLIVMAVFASGLIINPVSAAADDPVPDCSYAVNAGDISLSWTGVTGIDKYVAERTIDGGAWTWTGAPNAGTTSFTDNLPGAGTADGYRMFTKTGGVLSAATVCTDGAGGGGGGNDVVPDCSYVTNAGDISLSWTGVTGIDKYVAERTIDGGAWTWTAAPAAGLTTFSDNLPGAGTADGYRMFTKTGGVLSAPTVCTDGAGGGGGGADVVPSCTYWVSQSDNPTATAPDVIDVNWEPVTGVDKYVIERSIDDGAWTWSAAETDILITNHYDNAPTAGDVTAYRMFTKTGAVESAVTECTVELLPGNIVTPQRPFFPGTDTFRFGDIGEDPALTAAENETALEDAYTESCVALQDPIPVVSSGTRFEGISDSNNLGSSPFYIPRGGTHANHGMAYTWVPDGWQMRGIGDIELIEGRRGVPGNPIEVLFSVTPGYVAGFSTNGGLDPQSFEETGNGMDFAWTVHPDTIGRIPHKDYATDLYNEVGGQYQMIGISYRLGGARYGYDFTITVEPKPVAAGETVAPWVPEPCRIYEEIVSIPENNSIWDIDLYVALNEALQFMESFNTGCLNAAKDFIAGIIANLHQLVDFVNDPAVFISTKAGEIKTAIEAAANNPDQAFKDLIQWDLLQNNPGQWLGEVGCAILIDILLGATAAKIIDRANDFVRQNQRRADGDPDVDGDTDLIVIEVDCPLNSFPTGTPVLMGDGTHKPINEIEVGDLVVSYNTDTERWAKRPVLDQWSHLDTDQLVTVELADGSSVAATDHHLFWVASSQEWTPAEDLQTGDVLLDPDSAPVVADVQSWAIGENLVWELTVDTDHTFTVSTGTADVLVHNCKPKNKFDSSQQQLVDTMLDNPDGVLSDIFSVEVNHAWDTYLSDNPGATFSTWLTQYESIRRANKIGNAVETSVLAKIGVPKNTTKYRLADGEPEFVPDGVPSDSSPLHFVESKNYENTLLQPSSNAGLQLEYLIQDARLSGKPGTFELFIPDPANISKSMNELIERAEEAGITVIKRDQDWLDG